jgi:hypothetical protein
MGYPPYLNLSLHALLIPIFYRRKGRLSMDSPTLPIAHEHKTGGGPLNLFQPIKAHPRKISGTGKILTLNLAYDYLC